MNFATIIATFTPTVPGFKAVSFKADVFFNEEEFLSEPQPARPRARQFMSNDGQTAQYIDNFAINGKRDISIIDGEEADALIHMANSNPQPPWNMSFRYQRNDQDSAEVREHFHQYCKFDGHPARVMSNDIVIVKFTFMYSILSILGPDGNPV